jgi:hypothetical protein
LICASASSVRAFNKEKLEPKALVSTMAQTVAHEDGFVGNTFSSPQSRGSVMSPKHTSVMLNGGTNVKAAGTGVYLGGRYSKEDIVAFGGISDKEMGVQSSARIRSQPNADAPQMERAQLLTQAKNEVSRSGTYSKFSLASLSNDTVVSRACLGQ